MKDYIKTVLEMKEVRDALKKQKIGICDFKKYGFVNKDHIAQTYIIGMGKWRGVYDFPVIEIKIKKIVR